MQIKALAQPRQRPSSRSIIGFPDTFRLFITLRHSFALFRICRVQELADSEDRDGLILANL